MPHFSGYLMVRIVCSVQIKKKKHINKAHQNEATVKTTETQ